MSPAPAAAPARGKLKGRPRTLLLLAGVAALLLLGLWWFERRSSSPLSSAEQQAAAEQSAQQTADSGGTTAPPALIGPPNKTPPGGSGGTGGTSSGGGAGGGGGGGGGDSTTPAPVGDTATAPGDPAPTDGTVWSYGDPVAAATGFAAPSGQIVASTFEPPSYPTTEWKPPRIPQPDSGLDLTYPVIQAPQVEPFAAISPLVGAAEPVKSTITVGPIVGDTAGTVPFGAVAD